MTDATPASAPQPTPQPTPQRTPQPTPGQLLEAAYAQHAAACRLYARQLLNAADAEDAAHEAFVRLMGHLVRAGELPRAPRAWLLTATRSAALDLIRGERRRRLRERMARPAEAFVNEPGANLDAGTVAEALAALPQRQRETVVLRLWGELGFSAIADLLGVATSTAHADYAAGVAALRARLDPESSRNRRWTAPISTSTSTSTQPPTKRAMP